VFNWFSAGSRWARENRSFFGPPELARESEDSGRRFILIRYALLLLLLRGLAGRTLWKVVPVTPLSGVWLQPVLFGISGGIILLAFRRIISLLSPRAASAEMNDYFLQGSVILWVTVFVVGGFVEEYWRAFCVVALQQNGYSGIVANLLSAFAFLLAHLSGLPSRIRPGGAGPEMIIGLTLGGLFIWTGNLVAPCVASIIYFTSNYFQVRRRFNEILPSRRSA
jgi:Type II CAAX prenyl endopeptidase Rce1-like